MKRVEYKFIKQANDCGEMHWTSVLRNGICIGILHGHYHIWKGELVGGLSFEQDETRIKAEPFYKNKNSFNDFAERIESARNWEKSYGYYTGAVWHYFDAVKGTGDFWLDSPIVTEIVVILENGHAISTSPVEIKTYQLLSKP